MTELLANTYTFANTYVEQVLLELSLKQNGNAALVTVHDDQGVRVGYTSPVAIDLTDYPTALVVFQKNDLVTYAKKIQDALVNGGVTINVSSDTMVPKLIFATTDIAGRTNLSGLVALAQMAPSFSSTWVQSSGSTKLSSQEIITLGLGVGTFVEQTYATLATVLAGIADASIQTTAEIDAAPWPKTE